MNPDEIGKSGTEHALQSAFFSWAQMTERYGFTVAWQMEAYAMTPEQIKTKGWQIAPIPDIKWIHAIPNGGSRGCTSRAASIRGAAMRAEGVKPGIFDVFWPFGGQANGLYLEFKTKTGRLSKEQLEFETYARDKRYILRVVRDWREAAEIVSKYYYSQL